MKIWKNPLALFFLLFTLSTSFAQTLSEQSKTIKLAFDELQKNPTSKAKQLAYVGSFPQNKQQFMAVFQPANLGQLYRESFKYITAFFDQAAYHPAQVVDKALNIAQGLTWQANATGQMQNAMIQLANQYPKLFAAKVKTMQAAQVTGLINFLADVDNHTANPVYAQIIESLKSVGETGLAERFKNGGKVKH